MVVAAKLTTMTAAKTCPTATGIPRFSAMTARPLTKKPAAPPEAAVQLV